MSEKDGVTSVITVFPYFFCGKLYRKLFFCVLRYQNVFARELGTYGNLLLETKLFVFNINEKQFGRII